MNGISHGKFFILYGPSGSGKSTLLTQILKRLPENLLASVITYTSRLPRANEVNGKDYHFITQEDFLEKLNAGFFVHATNYHNKRYGCSKSIITDLEAGKNLIAIFDRNGAREVKQSIPNSILIWITAPLEELEKRLTVRYAGTQEHHSSRLELAKQEIKTEAIEKIHDYKIINNDLEQALKELDEIIKKELSERR